MRTGDRELLREKRAIKVMEAQSQFPGHIFQVAGTKAGSCSRFAGLMMGNDGVSVRELLLKESRKGYTPE